MCEPLEPGSRLVREALRRGERLDTGDRLSCPGGGRHEQGDGKGGGSCVFARHLLLSGAHADLEAHS